MYAELTSQIHIAIKDLTLQEAQLLTQSLIELKGKLRENEHFTHEIGLIDRMYKEIDREVLIALDT